MKKIIVLIQIALCIGLSFKYPAMQVLLITILLKEGIVFGIGPRISRIEKQKNITEIMISIVLGVTLFMGKEDFLQANVLTTVSIFIMFIPFLGLIKKAKCSGICKIVLVLGIVILFVSGAVLPYAKQPKVQKKTKVQFDITKFYSENGSGERAKIISQNGEALEQRIRLISQAKEEIILSTFEFHSDTSGKQVMAAVADAAKRGVKVSVLTDGFPYITSMWGNPYFLALAEMENVEIKVYNPVRVWKPWTFMGRMHDKYLIVDDFAYILGGRNTYDYFMGDQPGYKNYDWDVLVYCAEAKASSIEQVRKYFTSVWSMPECRTLGKSGLWKWNPAVKHAKKELEQQKNNQKEKIDYTKITVPVKNIQLVSNPIRTGIKEPTLFYTIAELMKQGKENVKFHTPYIICDDWMLECLEEVCEQVKDVQMMTNSVANNGNPFGAMDYQKYKGKILNTGVKILEYDEGVSYHGKCFTIDDSISAIGSFNWDMRSVYLDTEIMLVVDSEELNEQLRNEMWEYEKNALKVVDKDNYELKEGTLPRKISNKKDMRIKVLKKIAGWARFLM